MDVCDPGQDMKNIRKLILVHAGKKIRLSRDKVCDIFRSADEGKLPLPPLRITKDKSYLVDPKSPLTQNDYEILFSSSSVHSEIRRVAKKVGLINVNKTKSELKSAIGRRLRDMKVREPVRLSGGMRIVKSESIEATNETMVNENRINETMVNKNRTNETMVNDNPPNENRGLSGGSINTTTSNTNTKPVTIQSEPIIVNSRPVVTNGNNSKKQVLNALVRRRREQIIRKVQGGAYSSNTSKPPIVFFGGSKNTFTEPPPQRRSFLNSIFGSKNFIKAATFNKERPGYMFKTGNKGTGYYKNVQPTVTSPIGQGPLPKPPGFSEPAAPIGPNSGTVNKMKQLQNNLNKKQRELEQQRINQDKKIENARHEAEKAKAAAVQNATNESKRLANEAQKKLEEVEAQANATKKQLKNMTNNAITKRDEMLNKLLTNSKNQNHISNVNERNYRNKFAGGVMNITQIANDIRKKIVVKLNANKQRALKNAENNKVAALTQAQKNRNEALSQADAAKNVAVEEAKAAAKAAAEAETAEEKAAAEARIAQAEENLKRAEANILTVTEKANANMQKAKNLANKKIELSKLAANAGVNISNKLNTMNANTNVNTLRKEIQNKKNVKNAELKNKRQTQLSNLLNSSNALNNTSKTTFLQRFEKGENFNSLMNTIRTNIKSKSNAVLKNKHQTQLSNLLNSSNALNNTSKTTFLQRFEKGENFNSLMNTIRANIKSKSNVALRNKQRQRLNTLMTNSGLTNVNKTAYITTFNSGENYNSIVNAIQKKIKANSNAKLANAQQKALNTNALRANLESVKKNLENEKASSQAKILEATEATKVAERAAAIAESAEEKAKAAKDLQNARNRLNTVQAQANQVKRNLNQAANNAQAKRVRMMEKLINNSSHISNTNKIAYMRRFSEGEKIKDLAAEIREKLSANQQKALNNAKTQSNINKQKALNNAKAEANLNKQKALNNAKAEANRIEKIKKKGQNAKLLSQKLNMYNNKLGSPTWPATKKGFANSFNNGTKNLAKINSELSNLVNAKEEANRKAKEEANRIAKEEANRKAKEEANRIAKEEANRKAKEEANRIAKEEANRKAKEEEERVGAKLKFNEINGLTGEDVTEFMKKWDASKNDSIFNQARKRGAGRLVGKNKTENRSKPKEENEFNASKAANILNKQRDGEAKRLERSKPKEENEFNASGEMNKLELEPKRNSLMKKARDEVGRFAGRIGKWDPAIKNAKNSNTITNLETQLNNKIALRKEIQASKIGPLKKRGHLEKVMQLKNNIGQRRKIFEQQLTNIDRNTKIQELSKYIMSLNIPATNKRKYVKETNNPDANLNMIRRTVNKQVEEKIENASKSLVADAIGKIQAKENKNIANASKSLVADAIEKATKNDKIREGVESKIKQIEGLTNANVNEFMNKWNKSKNKTIFNQARKRGEGRLAGKSKTEERAKEGADTNNGEATRLFNAGGGVKNLTRGKNERDVNKNVLERTRKLVGFGIGGKAREKFLTRGRGMPNTAPLVKELDERLALINKVKNRANRKELEKLIRNSNTTINRVRAEVNKTNIVKESRNLEPKRQAILNKISKYKNKRITNFRSRVANPFNSEADLKRTNAELNKMIKLVEKETTIVNPLFEESNVKNNTVNRQSTINNLKKLTQPEKTIVNPLFEKVPNKNILNAVNRQSAISTINRLKKLTQSEKTMYKGQIGRANTKEVLNKIKESATREDARKKVEPRKVRNNTFIKTGVTQVGVNNAKENKNIANASKSLVADAIGRVKAKNFSNTANSLMKKARTEVGRFAGRIGKWDPAIRNAKTVNALTNLEKQLNAKSKLRKEIRESKIGPIKKRGHLEKVMELNNNVGRRRRIFEEQLKK